MAGLREIGNRVAVKFGISQQKSFEIAEDIFRQIEELAVVEPVRTNVGTFKIVRCVARPGRNPKTGAPCMIPARAILRFKARKK